MYIDDLPHLSISAFSSLFRQAIARHQETEEKESTMAAGHFSLNEIEYSYRLIAKGRDIKFYALILRWKDGEGKERAERVFLQEMESPLGLSCYYYFICPFSGKLCRKLFQDSKGFLAGREAYKGVHYRREYKKPCRANNGSSKNSVFALLEFMEMSQTDPYRQRGKEYYRGKLTPYGKRLQKYGEKCEKMLQKYSSLFPSEPSTKEKASEPRRAQRQSVKTQRGKRVQR